MQRNMKFCFFLVLVFANIVCLYTLYTMSFKIMGITNYVLGDYSDPSNVNITELLTERNIIELLTERNITELLTERNITELLTERNRSLLRTHEAQHIYKLTPKLRPTTPKKPSLQQQATYHDRTTNNNMSIFACETILVHNNYTFDGPMDAITNNTGGLHRQNHDFHNQTFPDSKWCGRSLNKSDASKTSFTLLSKWLSNGGVNVVDLLQKSIIPCSLRCSPSSIGSSVHLGTSSRKQHQKLESSVNTPYTRLTNEETKILTSAAAVADYGLISNEIQSRVINLTDVDELKVGDTVTFRVDLFDGYGRAKKEGGDEVRIYAYDHSKGAGTPGIVVDLYNGSFLANVTVRWAGRQEVAVSLHHPREIIRTMVFLRHVLGTMRYLTSAFENGSYGEVTPCMWYPVIPGYDDICNLTMANGGLPWFCGKPISGNLTCADWVRAQSSNFVDPLPVTKGERTWLDKMNREPYIRNIPFGNSNISVRGDDSQEPVTPCWAVRHALTWQQEQPSGWFFQKKWRSSICETRNITMSSKKSWLTKKYVYFLGDSNMKKLFQVLSRDVCTVNASTELPFPGPMSCSNPDLGIRVFFMAHAHPFNLPHPDHFRKYNKPLSAWLDQIQHDEDVLVVCHLYLHFSQFTIPLYVLHVQDVVKGIVRLLSRNPRARVAIRGTHVAYKGWPVHAAGGDVLALQFNKVLKQEFVGLHERIMYLNGWDMTLAIGNLNFHPEKYVDAALMNQIFNHFIGRP